MKVNQIECSEKMNLFSGRRLIIATKHKKEAIIGPRVSEFLGVLPFVSSEFDTDQFGTFTGEIERKTDALATARMKCLMAMQKTCCDLAIASEGSFGMHPSYYFISCNEELIMLKDKKHDLEIVGRALSTDTNFDGKICSSENDLIDFANRTGFPEHALILRNGKDSIEYLFKGITRWDILFEKFKEITRHYPHAFVETDMRATYNPKRRLVIATATEDMLAKANSICQKCGMPGFGLTRVISGLPCEWCLAPTKSPVLFVHSCQMCGYSEELPSIKSHESPQYCDSCNP